MCDFVCSPPRVKGRVQARKKPRVPVITVIKCPNVVCFMLTFPQLKEMRTKKEHFWFLLNVFDNSNSYHFEEFTWCQRASPINMLTFDKWFIIIWKSLLMLNYIYNKIRATETSASVLKCESSWCNNSFLTGCSTWALCTRWCLISRERCLLNQHDHQQLKESGLWQQCHLLLS